MPWTLQCSHVGIVRLQRIYVGKYQVYISSCRVDLSTFLALHVIHYPNTSALCVQINAERGLAPTKPGGQLRELTESELLRWTASDMASMEIYIERLNGGNPEPACVGCIW